MSINHILITPLQPQQNQPQTQQGNHPNDSPPICVSRRVRRVTTPMFTKAVSFEPNPPPVQAAYVEPLQLLSNRTLSLSSPMLIPMRRDHDLTFDEACADPNFTVSPVSAGFIPKNAWGNQPIAFGLLVSTFFRKRNSMHCKFPYKLYNALRLTMALPHFFKYIGARWLTDKIFIVDKLIFARLLGVRSIDGSFFHQQGNFPSHGFEELQFILAQRVARENGIGDFDPSNLRFLQHTSGKFTRFSTEADINQLKWIKM